MPVAAWFMLASVPFSVGSMFMGTNFAVRVPMIMVAAELWVVGLTLMLSS